MLGLLYTRTVCTTHTAAVPCPRHLGTQHAHSRCRVKAAAPYQGEAERQQQGFAAPPNSIHCTDPVVTHAEQVLDRAERDLADYCALASSPECWAAHTYLAEKRHAAQKDDDPEHKGLLELEQLALNGMEVGSAAFARTLLLLQKSEARRGAAAEASTTAEHTSGALSSSAASSSTGFADDVVAAARRRLEGLNTEQRRRRFALLSLFQSYDVDHDGLIDLEQTQLALESLGAVLTDEDWATLSDALDHKFKIDFEDFMEVAEEWAPPTAVDALLTALAQPKQQQQAQKDQQAPTAGQQQGVAEAAPSGPCTAAITGEAPAIHIDSKSFLRHSTHMHGRHGHR